MANALFLSIKYLQDNTPINSNVDVKELYVFAKTAEDKHIQSVIGTKLYDYLKGIVVSSKASPPISISTNNQTILENLRDALIWFTLYDAFPFIGTKIRNIGIVQQSGDNIANASDNKEASLRNEILNNATSYMNKVKRYLCEYDSLYTEFKCDSWNLNPKLITKLNCGIAFDQKTKYVNDRTLRDDTNNIDYDYIRKWFNS
jgi:hypothetical protein